MVEEVFVARVVAGGKVTIPRRMRDLLNIEDGDYVRLSIVEAIGRTKRKQRRTKGKVKEKTNPTQLAKET